MAIDDQGSPTRGTTDRRHYFEMKQQTIWGKWTIESPWDKNWQFKFLLLLSQNWQRHILDKTSDRAATKANAKATQVTPLVGLLRYLGLEVQQQTTQQATLKTFLMLNCSSPWTNWSFDWNLLNITHRSCVFPLRHSD
jgi:hypothetical protein